MTDLPAPDALYDPHVSSTATSEVLLTHAEACDLLIEQRGAWPLRPVVACLVEGEIRYVTTPSEAISPAELLDQILGDAPLVIGLQEARRLAETWRGSDHGPAMLPIPIGNGRFVCRFVTPWVDVTHFMAFVTWLAKEDERLDEIAARSPRMRA